MSVNNNYYLPKDVALDVALLSLEPNSKNHLSEYSLCPDEILLNIFSKLDYKSLEMTSKVSRQWNSVSQDQVLWTSLLQRDWRITVERNSHALYHRLVSGKSSVTTHKIMIGSCFQIYKEQLIKGYPKGTIEVCDIKTGKPLVRLDKNLQKEMRCLQAKNGRVIVGYDDGSLDIWHLETWQFIKSILGPKYIKSLHIADSIFFVGSINGIIRVYDLTTGNVLYSLKHEPEEDRSEYDNDVYALYVSGSKLFAGQADGTIEIWDLETTPNCIRRFQGHTEEITNFQVIEKTLFSGSYDETIKAWDLETGSCLRTIKAEGLSRFQIVGSSLFYGWYNGIKILHLKTEKCHATLLAQEKNKDIVQYLHIQGSTIVSLVEGYINIYDLKI